MVAPMYEPGVPLETTWLYFQQRNREIMCYRAFLYLVFIGLFTFVSNGLRPIHYSFLMEDSLVGLTAREAFPNANFEKTFMHIANDADWWEWAETVLLPQTLREDYFNGEQKFRVLGGRMRESLAVYNQLAMPIRFRQARVLEGSCHTPVTNSRLIAPCWGHFSPESEDSSAMRGAEDYGGRFATGLSSIVGLEGYGMDYGTSGHIVDVPLHRDEALAQLNRMKHGLWIDEATRSLSVETVWHNANLDTTAYLRLHVDISPAGRFQPYVVVFSLRLHPYSQPSDFYRAGAEVAFCLLLLYYIVDELLELREVGKAEYLSSTWNVIEVFNLSIFLGSCVVWGLYLWSDRDVLGHEERLDEFRDITQVAANFQVVGLTCAFNIVVCYCKLFKYLQVYPRVMLIWRTLDMSMVNMLPFLVVFLLFATGFTFSGHWLFGHRIQKFHNFFSSYSTLMRTVEGGLPTKDMMAVSPRAAFVFTFLWILIMIMVLMNVAIAILNEGYSDCVDEMQTEERRLAITTGRSAKVSLFESIWIRSRTGAAKKEPQGVVPSGGLKGLFAGKKEDGGGGHFTSSGLQTVYDKCADTIAMRAFVKKVDLKQIEAVRRHVIQGSKMGVKELTPVFGGNLDAARKFCMHAWAVQKDIARQPHAEEEKSLEIEMLDDVKRSLDKVMVTIDRITNRMEAEENPYEPYTRKKDAEERKRIREEAALDAESGVLQRTVRKSVAPDLAQALRR